MSVKTLEWNHNEDDDGEHPQVPEKTWNRAMPDLSLSRRASNQTGLQKGRTPATQVVAGAGLAGEQRLGLCVAGQRGVDEAAVSNSRGDWGQLGGRRPGCGGPHRFRSLGFILWAMVSKHGNAMAVFFPFYR